MMLTTSYAWYSFETASTTFSGVTNNDDIKVSFQKGEYINTIYIGGGTPSSLNIEELTELFKIIKIFKKSKDIEFTFEFNI